MSLSNNVILRTALYLNFLKRSLQIITMQLIHLLLSTFYIPTYNIYVHNTYIYLYRQVRVLFICY